METTIDVPYASAYYDYKKKDDHYITFPAYKGNVTYGVSLYYADRYNTGTGRDEGLEKPSKHVGDVDTCVWEDERFVLEIPVQLKAKANLHNVKIKVDLGNREILEGGGSWVKLDFAPYCLHLDRSNDYALQYYDIATTSCKEFKGKLHPNSDAQDAYLLSNTYPMGDINAGEVTTAYVYVYVYANWGKFDANTGRIVATVPFEISSADGFSTSDSMTFKLYQGGVS